MVRPVFSGALVLSFALALAACSATSKAVPAAGAAPLAALNVAGYMGVWHQQGLYPNRFQKQCLSNTTATYRWEKNGTVAVANRCVTAGGKTEEALGIARPLNATVTDGLLQPASLEVSFAPAWVRGLGLGWGTYQVLHRQPDGAWVVVGEPSRDYLWVLSRAKSFSDADWSRVLNTVQGLGYETARLQRTPHTPD